MNKTVILYSLILLTSVFISSIAQVLLKISSEKKYDSVIKEYLNFRVVFAYGIFFGATLLSILAYKGIPMTLGTVLDCTSYIFVTVFGVIIFREKINKKKIAALALIIIGIIVFSI